MKEKSSTSPRRRKEEEAKRLKAEQEIKFESQASELDDDLEVGEDDDNLKKGDLSVSRVEQSDRVCRYLSNDWKPDTLDIATPPTNAHTHTHTHDRYDNYQSTRRENLYWRTTTCRYY